MDLVTWARLCPDGVFFDHMDPLDRHRVGSVCRDLGTVVDDRLAQRARAKKVATAADVAAATVACASPLPDAVSDTLDRTAESHRVGFRAWLRESVPRRLTPEAARRLDPPPGNRTRFYATGVDSEIVTHGVYCSISSGLGSAPHTGYVAPWNTGHFGDVATTVEFAARVMHGLARRLGVQLSRATFMSPWKHSPVARGFLQAHQQ